MKIHRVQYDGDGDWIEVTFDDGKRARFTANLVRQLAIVAVWDKEQEATNDGKQDSRLD